MFAILMSLALFAAPNPGQQIDEKKSTFKWHAEKKLGKAHWGNIKIKSSKVVYDGKEVKSAKFVMDMNSITVDNISDPWDAKFLEHIKSGDFFETSKFPTATLVLKERLGKNKVKGELTIKGKPNDVEIEYKIVKGVYKGKLIFDRTKFGVVYGSGNIFKELTADKVIKNEVSVEFSVALK